MTLDQIAALPKSGELIILDGAWGTELARRGLPSGECPEKWNIDHPEKVAEIPAAYAASGAHIVLTNTFGGNRVKLDKSGLADKAHAINHAGASISRQACAGRAFVFASVGPTGEFLEPLGLTTKEQMEDVYREQIAALAAGGADGIVIETFTDLEEALCALRAARAVSATMPVAVSMTFDKGARGYATMMGVTPAQAAQALDAAGADIIGSNCGNGIDNIIEIVAALRAHTAKPLWAKPNAGMPELIDGQTVFRQSPEQMAAKIPALIKAGASLIGGCCGTTPAHIKAIAEACAARK
ncbi:methionine synthase [bacterium]|nr:methionine synthase [bacterium]